MDGKVQSITAFGLASGASLAFPPLRGLALALGTIAGCDPDGIRRAGGVWREAFPPTRHYSVGSGGINEFQDKLAQTMGGVVDGEHWKGDGFETFSARFAEYNQAVDKLRSTGNGMAQTMDSAANVYDVAAAVAMVFGVSSAAVAAAATIFRLAGPVGTPAFAYCTAAAFQLSRAAWQTSTKTRTMCLAVGGIAATVAAAYSASADKFPGMQPMVTATPDFTPMNLEFNDAMSGTGGLVDPPPDPTAAMPDGMGMLGLPRYDVT